MQLNGSSDVNSSRGFKKTMQPFWHHSKQFHAKNTKMINIVKCQIYKKKMQQCRHAYQMFSNVKNSRAVDNFFVQAEFINHVKKYLHIYEFKEKKSEIPFEGEQRCKPCMKCKLG